jgi:hypothetical protein
VAPERYLVYDLQAMPTMRNCLFAALGAVLAAMAFSSIPAHSQAAPLPLGVIHRRSITPLSSCPAGYYPGMSCFKGEVDDCPSTVNLGFTYGFKNPSTEPVGTIVFLEGGGGTSAYLDPTFPQKYLEHGYQVVYLAWDADWEFSDGTTGTSIKNAACRPATFINYIYENLYTKGGMCAQADSAGSAAVAYSLAWYGSANYLDNVELLSGPVFGNIEQGCVVPHAPTVNVCATGQYGCNGAQWPDPPFYVDGDQGEVGQWSGQHTCNKGATTTQTANSAWKSMSIVDGTNNPSFNYPQTALAGYLCSNIDSVQNNSAAQGEFFYQQFTGPRQTAGYSVTRIDNCNGVEGVSSGTTPQGESGFDAISEHMLSACVQRH